MTTKINFPYTQLPEKAQILRKNVRAFLEKEVSNGIFQPHIGDGFNRDFSLRVGEQGWIGMTWPKEYGGQELSQFERYVVTEEMLLAGAPTWAHFTADRQSGPILLKYGSDKIKRRILPRIVKGECTFAIGMSEPDSGSDLFAARTHAERCADGWLVNGRKTWTSFAHKSQYMIGLFRTASATDENRRHGLTQFLVDMQTPGLTINPIRNSAGQHDFNDVIFEDVVVPEDHMLGELDMAWQQVTSELAFERSGPERFLQNIHVLTELIRIIGKRPNEHTAERLGRLIAQLQSLRQMSISVAGMLSAGKEPVLEASIVKDVGTNWEQELPNTARDISSLLHHDEDATNRTSFEDLIQQSVIMSPKYTIQGGTREILRGVIARGLGVR
jgi:acyl-CoA dehydrogenase